MKHYIKMLTIILFKTNIIFASTIKVAVLDNLLSQKLSSVNYGIAYMNAVRVAAQIAKSKGIQLDYKFFFYNKEPLNILSQISLIKQWQPDVIIGPRLSDKFLFLRNYFKDILVISPLANADQIYSLPSNFYTIAAPEKYLAKAIVSFVNKQFQTPKHIYVFTAVDCLSCFNVSNNFIKDYSNKHPQVIIYNRPFLTNTVETIDIKTVMKNYTLGDIIITPNFSYPSSILITAIANYLKIPDIVFIGSDGWGNTITGEIGKLKTIVPVMAYKVIQLEETQNLYTLKEQNNQIPFKRSSELIANSVYKTLMAICSVSPSKQQNNIRSVLLENFLKSIKDNPNKYRSHYFYVYNVKNSSENLIESIQLQLGNN